MKTAISILLVAVLVLAGACKSTRNAEETQSAVPDSTTGAEIKVSLRRAVILAIHLMSRRKLFSRMFKSKPIFVIKSIFHPRTLPTE